MGKTDKVFIIGFFVIVVFSIIMIAIGDQTTKKGDPISFCKNLVTDPDVVDCVIDLKNDNIDVVYKNKFEDVIAYKMCENTVKFSNDAGAEMNGMTLRIFSNSNISNPAATCVLP